MRLLFYFGLSMLGLAFVAAAAETVSHAMPGGENSFIIPARDLWYALWPKSFLIAEIRAERIAPWLWDPVILTILQLPGWAVLGIPGGFIAWFTRPNHGTGGDHDVEEVLASFDLYDELTREALKTNDPDEEHGPQDIHPDDPIEGDIVTDHSYEPYTLPPKRSDGDD
ncbi:MAG: hypothetical protein HOK06_00810 [Rhodospirillaceae bacterium]|nr:hypothetical protein [Rhodospirillaceae bacterium]